MTEEEREEFRQWCEDLNKRNHEAHQRWVADGRPVIKPKRKPLTDEQKAARKARRKWRESWCRPGDAPSRGHMKKNRRR